MYRAKTLFFQNPNKMNKSLVRQQTKREKVEVTKKISEQLYANKVENLDSINAFLEKYNLLKLND